MMPAAWITVSASARPAARPNSISGTDRSVLVDVLGQRRTLGVFGDHERRGRLGVGFDHPHCERALDPDQRRHLATEPAAEFLVRLPARSAAPWTATGLPSQATPRYTTPMPPEPSLAVSR